MGEIPRATRPDMGYFRDEVRLLPWAWAEERLAVARNYWVASVSGAGTAHSRPVWGVWDDSAFWFSTGSRIGTHLVANPEATVHLESGDEVVILEGRASRVEDRDAVVRFCDVFNAKYRWDFRPDDAGALFVVRPRVAFGWVSDGSGLDRGATFNGTGTRWLFEA